MSARKFLFGDNATLFFVAVLGLTLIDISRKGYMFSVVKSMNVVDAGTLTLSGSVSVSAVQLITVAGLAILLFVMIKSNNRVTPFHPWILLLCATIMAIGYLSKLNNGSNTPTYQLFQIVFEFIKLCGIIITLAWAKALFDHEGNHALVLCASSMILSGAIEAIFAFLPAVYTMALCLSLPFFSVILLLLYLSFMQPTPTIHAIFFRSSTTAPQTSPSDRPAGSQQKDTRALVWFCVIFACYGVIRALEHDNIAIAQQLQNGPVLVQLFDSLGPVAAGLLLLGIMQQEDNITRYPLYKGLVFVCFLIAAFIYLSAKSFAVLSIFTTFGDVGYRIAMFFMWAVALTFTSKHPPITLFAILTCTYQVGDLLGGVVESSEIGQILTLIVCFTILIVNLLPELVHPEKAGAQKQNVPQADTPAPDAAQADMPSAQAINDILFTVYLAMTYHLTEREFEIMMHIVKGEDNRTIGNTLYIAPGTVKKHRYNIYQKMGVSTQEELDAKINQAREQELPAFIKSLTSESPAR